MKRTKLMLGDNIQSLQKLPDNSIDSIVSDPPYGLSFMGKKWDYDVPSVEFWKEVYRVLKPGGHVLSFGGTRTYHRMVVNIEDAGFEIRDQIMWLYGSGFPKSHNIGKAVDKLQGNNREVVGDNPNHRTTAGLLELGFQDGKATSTVTKGSSPYEGWGTALKPANEPICVARKPLSEKSVAENVLRWGTGGINIDGCRVGSETISVHNAPKGTFAGGDEDRGSDTNSYREHEGRFPANIILDEIAGELLDEQSGYLKSGEVKPHHKKNKTANGYQGSCYGKFQNEDTTLKGYGDSGGASRFFYQAKVSKAERNMGLDGFEIEILTPTIKLLLKTDYNNKNFIWEKEDLKTKLADTDKSHQKDIEEYTTMEDNKWNTELFGNIITEQFLMDVKSIIETKTNSTTIYQTLNLLIQKNIKKNIQELLGEMVSDINFVEDVEKKSTKVIIISQKKDGLNQNVNPVLLEEAWNISVKENKCSHPTLKPVSLMSYLCRLVTPPNGIVLDPFMGSGSTGIAAQLEGFRFCGMEMDADYFKIAEARIENYEQYKKFIK
jgi:site-specific DNA-methyltransferase (adenine-specific)